LVKKLLVGLAVQRDLRSIMGVMVDLTRLGLVLVTLEEAMGEVGEAILAEVLARPLVLGAIDAGLELKGMPYRAQ
jgi:hypothetical protein